MMNSDKATSATSHDSHDQAAKFWQRELAGFDGSSFPPPPTRSTSIKPTEEAERRFPLARSLQRPHSSTIICQAALATLLTQYTRSHEIVFGDLRELTPSKAGPDGAKRSLVPARITGATDLSIGQLLQKLAARDAAVSEYGRIGLESIIRETGDVGAAACAFQTVLKVSTSVHGDNERFPPFTNYGLLLDCQLSSDGIVILAQYSPELIDDDRMDRFLLQFGGLIQQFHFVPEDRPVRDLCDISPEDRAQIERWNSEPPQTTETCIHDAISAAGNKKPDATAVFSWDGEWTYAELETVSSRLARHIQSFDTLPGETILLCFEKSKWMVAAMLAVLKSGRVFSLVDPSLPAGRIAKICQQTSTSLALASPTYCDLMIETVSDCVAVSDPLLDFLPRTKAAFKSIAKPRDAAYVIFTSGSTGQPKGIIVEHQGFTSCSLQFGLALGIHENTRALQFASFAFGASLVEIMTTLMLGGCVCMPSENDRINDVPGFIQRAQVNWALLTPSFVGVIQPDNVPTLETLVLVGEPMSAEMRDTWAPRLQLLYGYGQSESSSCCSVARVAPDTVELNNIGHAAGARFWITDPEDPNRLAPIGSIGELIVESPGIARGYLGDVSLDKSPFLTGTPGWSSTLDAGSLDRLYRTGDLVYYSVDGTVVNLGRKDAQVKIRGQRVELGDVEVHLRQQVPKNITPVVEAVRSSDGRGKATLVAFLIGASHDESGPDASSDAFILDPSISKRIQADLKSHLPSHSIPTSFIGVKQLPTTATGKTDRKKLRSMGVTLLNLDDHLSNLNGGEQLTKSSNLEARLRHLWFGVLGVSPEKTASEATFFDLGGDSIAAIKLVNMAKSLGIALQVADILKNPTLNDFMSLASSSQGSTQRSTIHHEPAEQTGPVKQSYAQGRLWFLNQLNVGASWYNIPLAVRLRGSLDVAALTIALHALEQRHETLRTVFEQSDGEVMQVVEPCSTKPLELVDLSRSGGRGYSEELHEAQTAPFNLTSERGWRTALFYLGPEDHVLSIVLHHIIADGWSIDILSRELDQFYVAACQGKDPLAAAPELPVQYRDFSLWQHQDEQLAADRQRQLKYWTAQLADSAPAEFLVDRPRPSNVSGKAGSIPVTLEGPAYDDLREFCRVQQVTPYIALLAAFRATHFRMSGTADATIGTPVANRSRPELEPLIGFFVNTQCMRITIEENDTFQSVVEQVKATASDAFANQDVSCRPSLFVWAPLTIRPGSFRTACVYLAPRVKRYISQPPGASHVCCSLAT